MRNSHSRTIICFGSFSLIYPLPPKKERDSSRTKDKNTFVGCFPTESMGELELSQAWIELSQDCFPKKERDPSLRTFYISVLFSAACYRRENYGGFSQKHLPRTQFNSARRISLSLLLRNFHYLSMLKKIRDIETNGNRYKQNN